VRAPAESYTLLYAISAKAVNAAVYDKLNFMHDIAPVAVVGIGLKQPCSPSLSLRELPVRRLRYSADGSLCDALGQRSKRVPQSASLSNKPTSTVAIGA